MRNTLTFHLNQQVEKTPLIPLQAATTTVICDVRNILHHCDCRCLLLAVSIDRSITQTMVKTVPDNNNKQKNLFSFFSKKTASSSPSSVAAAFTTAPSTTNNNIQQHKQLLSKLAIGTKLAVYWPDDDEYYPCTIREQRRNHSLSHPGYVFELHYENGEVENVDLSCERFSILGGSKIRIGEEEEDESHSGKKPERMY